MADAKKKKGNKQQAPKPMDDAALNDLVNQKLREFGISSEDDKEVKKLRKKYYPISKAAVQTLTGDDDATKLNTLVSAFNQLLELNSFFEEHSYILERYYSQAKGERDLLQGDISKLHGLKSNFEKFARDVEKNNAKIKEINKSFVEEETQKREDIIKNFENTINEIQIKLDEQRLAAQEQIQENTKLKAEFEEKIKVYETREKEFFEQVKSLDSQNDDKTKGILGNLNDIQERARKAFEIKDQIAAIKKQETEDKLKIAVYSQRFGDLDTTFGNTIQVLQRFKEELLRSGSRIKGLWQENKELKEKNEKMSNYALELLTLNEDAKKKIAQSLKEKDALKAKALSIQNEILAKTKQIQELEKTKTA